MWIIFVQNVQYVEAIPIQIFLGTILSANTKLQREKKVRKIRVMIGSLEFFNFQRFPRNLVDDLSRSF